MTFGEWLKWFGNLFVKEILTYFIDPASRFILIGAWFKSNVAV